MNNRHNLSALHGLRPLHRKIDDPYNLRFDQPGAVTTEIVEAAYVLGNENDDANLVPDDDVVKILTAKEIVSSMLLLAPWEVLVEIGEYAANFAAVADELNNDPYLGKYTLAGTVL